MSPITNKWDYCNLSFKSTYYYYVIEPISYVMATFDCLSLFYFVSYIYFSIHDLKPENVVWEN